MTRKYFKLTTCESGDWEILEQDGCEVASGHHIDNCTWVEVLRNLGCDVDEECISDDEMEQRC